MVSSRKRSWSWGTGLVLLVAQACSVGPGERDIAGTVQIAGCKVEGSYKLSPTAFLAQATEQQLHIRAQRGSDLEVKSDGLAVLVEDATLVKSKFLGASIDVAPDSKPAIDLSLFLNESCPPGRDQTPVLNAVSGSIRFEAIYAPEVDENEVQIKATIENVRFEDPRDSERWAELSGDFDFLYARGAIPR